MKSRYFFAASLLTFCAWLLGVSAARADTVLYDSSSIVQGQQAFTQSFNVMTPGALTITVAGIPWLDAISNLTYFLTTASGTVGTSMSGGSETVNIDAGTIYAHWFGTAQGNYDIGVLGIKIVFQPSTISPVPLPATLILLLSGLGILFGWQRSKVPVGAAVA
jgi:hypothetical protein